MVRADKEKKLQIQVSNPKSMAEKSKQNLNALQNLNLMVSIAEERKNKKNSKK